MFSFFRTLEPKGRLLFSAQIKRHFSGLAEWSVRTVPADPLTTHTSESTKQRWELMAFHCAFSRLNKGWSTPRT